MRTAPAANRLLLRALRPSLPSLAALLVVGAAAPCALDAASAEPPSAQRTLEDYRHFRITAIDLLGRMPTREEIGAFDPGMPLAR